jgi:hypothetical protein
MVGGGVGAAVVGGGAGVVGGGVGAAVVGGGAGVVGGGVGDVVADVGAAVVGFGLADGFAAPAVGAGDAALVGSPAVAGGPQVTLYAAGLDAATAGLVTTSTTCPDAGTQAGNVSGSAAFVPPEAKVAESGFVRSPLDIAQ